MIKNLLNWYKGLKEHADISVYFDRLRKGWFFRIGDNRHGYRGSLDKGYENRKKALEAMKRFFKKNGEPEPPVGPEPPEEPLVTAFQYNRITSPKICEYRRLRYGSSLPPSDSAYMSLFGGFEEEWPWVDVTQFYKSQIEQRQDNNFIILELLHLLEYEPVYDENNRCIGLTDFTGGNPYVS